MGGVVSTITDDVLGFDPGGGGIYDVARDVLGDTIADDVLGFDPNGGGIVPIANTAANIATAYLIGQGVAGAFGAGGTLATDPFSVADAAQLANQGLSQAQIAATLQSTGLSATQAAAAAAAGYDAAFVAADASQLFSQGLDVAQIESTLLNSGVDPFVAADAAQLAASGVNASGITQNLLQSASGVTDLFSGGTTLQDGSFINKAGQLFDSAGNFVKQLATSEVGQLIGQAGQAYLTNDALKGVAEAQRTLGSQTAAKAEQIGQQAAVPFTPYTVTTGTGTATVSPTGATTALTPELQGIQSGLFSQAGQAFGAINPAQATQQMYGQLEALAQPTREIEQNRLLGSLGQKGLLGFGQNIPTVGGVQTVNPYVQSLLSAQQGAQAQNALAALQYGTSEAQRQASLGQGLLTTGTGLEAQAQDALGRAYQYGSGITGLAQTDAQRAAEAALTGLKYQTAMNLNAADIEAMRQQQLAQAAGKIIGDVTGTGTAGQTGQSGNTLTNTLNTVNNLNNLYKTGSSLYNSASNFVGSLFG